MTRSSQTIRIAIALLLVLLAQACAQFKVENDPAPPTSQDIESPVPEEQPTPFPPPTATVEVQIPATTEAPPAAAPSVTITAIKGNLFIRRGPDMAFNSVGILYKNTSAKATARDILSNWVRIKIPNSNKMGWVSIQTEYSQVEGNLEDLPEFTTTEWPVAAYLRNCTYHRMYVLPSEVVVYPSLEFPDNEIWIYPGTYKVYDIDVEGDPEVAKITVKEGAEIEIREDGLGERRKCP